MILCEKNGKAPLRIIHMYHPFCNFYVFAVEFIILCSLPQLSVFISSASPQYAIAVNKIKVGWIPFVCGIVICGIYRNAQFFPAVRPVSGCTVFGYGVFSFWFFWRICADNRDETDRGCGNGKQQSLFYFPIVL